MRFLQLFSYLFFVSFLLLSCEEEKKKISKPIQPYDLSDIQKKGELVILTENSSTSYFNYRGKTMGFEYEILKDFAASFDDIFFSFKFLINSKRLKDVISVINQLLSVQQKNHYFFQENF